MMSNVDEMISLLQSVQRGLDDDIYNFTKDGDCSSCGNCCSNLLVLSDKEKRVIHKFIIKHNIHEIKHIIPTSKQTHDLTCPFRDNENKICTIYPVRPDICRQFICDSEKRVKYKRKKNGQRMNIVLMRDEFYGGKNESS